MIEPNLTSEEREIVLALLKQERKDLHSEIRRTRGPSAHDDLEKRLETVEKLIAKMTGQTIKTD